MSAEILYAILLHSPSFAADEPEPLQSGDFYEVSAAEYKRHSEEKTSSETLVRHGRRGCQVCFSWLMCKCGRHPCSCCRSRPRRPSSTLPQHSSKSSMLLNSWQLELSPNGKHVAILKDSSLCVRAEGDGFSSGCEWSIESDDDNQSTFTALAVAAISTASAAAFPQFSWLRDRRDHVVHLDRQLLAWSVHSDLLALARRSGSIVVYDIRGRLRFSGHAANILEGNFPPASAVPAAEHSSSPLRDSGRIVGLSFREAECQLTSAGRCPELIILEIDGTCFRFHIPVHAENGVPHMPAPSPGDPKPVPPSSGLRARNPEKAKQFNTFPPPAPVSDNVPARSQQCSLAADQHHEFGAVFVGSTYHTPSNILAVASIAPQLATNASNTIVMHRHTVSLWRILDESPFFQLVCSSFDPSTQPMVHRTPHSWFSLRPWALAVGAFLGRDRKNASTAHESLLYELRIHPGTVVVRSISPYSLTNCISGFLSKVRLSEDMSHVAMVDLFGQVSVWRTSPRRDQERKVVKFTHVNEFT